LRLSLYKPNGLYISFSASSLLFYNLSHLPTKQFVKKHRRCHHDLPDQRIGSHGIASTHRKLAALHLYRINDQDHRDESYDVNWPELM